MRTNTQTRKAAWLLALRGVIVRKPSIHAGFQPLAVTNMRSGLKFYKDQILMVFGIFITLSFQNKNSSLNTYSWA